MEDAEPVLPSLDAIDSETTDRVGGCRAPLAVHEDRRASQRPPVKAVPDDANQGRDSVLARAHWAPLAVR